MDVSVETQKDRHRELKEQREIERQAREQERQRMLQQMVEDRKAQERAENFDFNRSEIELNGDFRAYKKRTPKPYVSKQRLFTFVEPEERKTDAQHSEPKPDTVEVETDILPPPEEPLDIPALDPFETDRDETQSIVDAAVKEAKQNERKNKREVKSFQEEAPSRKQAYILPPVDCLEPPDFSKSGDIAGEIKTTSAKLLDTLKSFGVETTLTGVSRGPSVTRYELQPAPGVKISKITSLTDDIALNLAASGVRIEAPIPNKSAVGIEVPNQTRASVMLREIIASSDFQNAKSKLNVALGKDISGNVKCTDLAKMPHLLIAGTTGSGKSVCLNCMVCSILYNATPDEVKLLMIDPKQVEFSVYNGIPHLLVPVISDVRKAAASLAWAVGEMENRYKLFSSCGVRDIVGFNKLVPSHPEYEFMPQIVIFIDELNDLMMISPKEVEDSICRLAQKARAAGMHLVVATQRPSVDVITGIIKANIPSRLSLSVSSQVDSRTILDTIGAEKLLGNGDMLFNPVGISKPVRIQGAFISEGEIEKIVDFIKSQAEVNYDNDVMEEIERQAVAEKKKNTQAAAGDKIADADEAMIEEAINVVVECQAASTTLLQRKLRLGYGRAARIMDQLEKMGVVGPADGAKPRKVMMTQMQLAERRASADYSDGADEDAADFDIFSDD
ncbi:MAG: DNA translocase FtsK [Clostridia bacterium]|nr:DNA translocase FtsK [Clostridia bacterium]